MGNYQIILFIVAGIGMMALLGGLMFLSNQYSLNGIKSKTVGDGQYGTARFATEKEIRETYVRVAYEPEKWRRGENLPKAQGLVVGWRRTGGKIDALIDSGDIHCLMIGAAGVGKTAHFLYPNIEYPVMKLRYNIIQRKSKAIRTGNWQGFMQMTERARQVPEKERISSP